MKKAMLLTGALLMLMTTFALGSVESDRFVNSVQEEIYRSSRTGDLTRNEVRVLRNLLLNYEDKVWQYSGYGAISRQEKRQLIRMEDHILEKLEELTFNRVTVRSQRYNRPTTGVYYGNTRPYYTPRRSPATSRRPTTTRAPRRGGGTYCPPPRGRY